MKNNKLIISAAGSGKTTHLVNKALGLPKTEQILITTYTNENEEEIRKKILDKHKSIPQNITVQGRFSFLLQHGVRPYQGAMNDMLFKNDIKGMLLSEGKSAPKCDSKGQPLFLKGRIPIYYGENDFKKFYFTNNWNIYSDKISKFIVGCNEKTNGEIISRISRIYAHIFIDEVQDLAGFDLSIIKLLLESDIEIILVGDPRQVTYLTNHYNKYPKYKNGKIKEFIQNECNSLIDENTIDETTLKKSHRNNKDICDYSSRLYPEFAKSEPCNCEECRNNVTEHEGVFLVRTIDIKEYLIKYKPIQLIWNSKTPTKSSFPALTFGKSKGKTYDRVLIYPTPNVINWIKDNNYNFTKGNSYKKEKLESVREKFYVALTRARHSVAIVFDYKDNEQFEIVKKYIPE